MAYYYVEAMLLDLGHAKKCQEFPTRVEGQSAESWLEDVKGVVAAGLKCHKWGNEFAADMLFYAELLVAELRRYPVMIGWDQELYVAAVESRTHPEDEHGMSLLTEPDFFGDDGPLDAETVAFLNDLAADDSDGARA